MSRTAVRGEHVTHQGIASSYTYVHTGSQALPRKQGHFSSQSLRAFRAHSYPTLPTTSFLKQAHARSAPPKSPVGMSTVSSRRSAMTPRRPKAAMALLELSAETPRRMIRCPRYVLSSGCGVSLCVCACARACACACACVRVCACLVRGSQSAAAAVMAGIWYRVGGVVMGYCLCKASIFIFIVSTVNARVPWT